MAYGSINADSIVTSVSGGVLGGGNASIMKNRIINGAMVINQRGFSGAITDTGATTYTLDRWYAYGTIASKFTVAQSSTASTGFNNSLLATSSSAYTVGAGELFILGQSIEGYNVADLGWGTASAKTVTLSFQVRSSLTGTFGGSILNSAQDRSYPFTYTISAANTWTTISVTIAGDTSGTWLTTNGIGLKIYFGLGVGSTYTGTAGAWASATYFSATGATSVVGTSGATFYITGVQLEVGSSATGFEYRQYQQELALCQRYYETSYIYGTVAGTVGANGGNFSVVPSNTIAVTQVYNSVSYIVTKRAIPTLTCYGYSGNSGQVSREDTGADLGANSGKLWSNTTTVFVFYNGTGGTLTTNYQNIQYFFTASAEL